MSFSVKKFEYGEFPGGSVDLGFNAFTSWPGFKTWWANWDSVSNTVQQENFNYNYFKGMVQNRSSQSHLPRSFIILYIYHSRLIEWQETDQLDFLGVRIFCLWFHLKCLTERDALSRVHQ